MVKICPAGKSGLQNDVSCAHMDIQWLFTRRCDIVGYCAHQQGKKYNSKKTATTEQ